MTAQKTNGTVQYAEEVAKIVSGLQLREAVEVYDFALFLQAKSEGLLPIVDETDDDWLNDSEEDMLAEDALWDEMFARNPAVFALLDEETKSEIELGITQPMFDADGELIIDELPHNA